jgi:hypothetical protein
LFYGKPRISEILLTLTVLVARTDLLPIVFYMFMPAFKKAKPKIYDTQNLFRERWDAVLVFLC